MKKQLVLSLSVLMLIVSTEVAYGFIRSTPASAVAPAPVTKQADVSAGPAAAAVLSTAEEVAASGVTLDDVALALQKLGANPTNGKTDRAAKAQSFIQTGTASSASLNKSHKLGRLSRNK